MSESCDHNCSSCHSNCSERKEEAPSRLLPIKHKLLVMSGKGGVGKSTVAASLAVSLAREGFKVALLDVDFHGPSQPTLFGKAHEQLTGNDDGLIPLDASGIKLISLGLLLGSPDNAVVLRGPAKMGIIKQLFEETQWGDDLDYLILDFPPGTGDEALSACQLIPGDKRAIIVTTPQEVSLADCRKCLDFCAKVDVPVLGIMENMSSFVCPECKTVHSLFSSNGGQKLADAFGIPLLAQIPMDPSFLKACDEGRLPLGLADAPAVNEEIGKAVHEIIAAASITPEV